MIYALLSMIFFGVSDALWRPTVSKYSYNSIVFSRTIVSSLALLLFAILFEEYKSVSYSYYLMVFFFGSMASFAFMFLIKAFEYASTSIVITLNSATLIVTQITSFLFFDEKVIWGNYILVFSLILAAILMLNNLSFKLNKGIKYALASSVLFGVAYPLLSIPVIHIGNYQTAFVQEITLLFWILIYVYKNRSIERPKVLFNKSVITLGMLSSVGLSFLFYAYSFMEVYKVHLISSFYPIPALLIAFLCYKEKLSKVQVVGMLLSLLSTFLIGIDFI